MSKLITLIFFFSMSCALYAQCPSSGNHKLENQDEVDAFCNGGTNCTINGKLEIDYKNGTPITDLSPLDCIVAVTGDLKVKDCDITDLDGLGNITSIGGSFKIEDNTSLTDLDGLGAIGSIGEELKIKGNTVLSDISGLTVITSVGTSLKIEDNPALTSLNGLQSITGAVSRDLKIKGNTLLTSIEKLSGITSVGNNLEIDGNPDLATLNGLQGITSVGNDLKIKNNTTLGSGGESDCISIPAGICTAVNNGIGNNIEYSGNHSNCNLSEAEVEAACLAALPVELVDFRVKEDEQKNVVLFWTTASETNNMHFVIERAADGRNFEALETVNGNGTSTGIQNYSFVDSKPISFAYYRLKQVDYDGAFEYSDIIFWELKKLKDDKIVAFPTNAENEINLRINTSGTKKSILKIVNSQGRIMYDEAIYTSGDLEYRKLDLKDFNTGIYSIILSDGFDVYTLNFVVTKTY